MKTAFLFSGQGAQYPGMMKDIFESEIIAREIFDIADKTLGRSISSICFEGTQEELNLTHNTQPCVLAADLVAGMVLRAHGIEPAAVAGFSLGEYAAITFAGVLTAEQVFPMIQLRADAMQKAVPPGQGAMAAIIGVSASKVEEICRSVSEEYVIAANYNSPVQTVVSGTKEGVEKAIRLAEAEKIRCISLPVSAPFHCKLMEPAAEKLKNYFSTQTFCDPSIPVYMNFTAEMVSCSEEIPDLLVKQAAGPVQWVKTLEALQAEGVDTFIECGPGRTLSGLVKKTLKNVMILRVENIQTLKKTLEALK